jgi:acyl-CoA thioesterase
MDRRHRGASHRAAEATSSPAPEGRGKPRNLSADALLTARLPETRTASDVTGGEHLEATPDGPASGRPHRSPARRGRLPDSPSMGDLSADTAVTGSDGHYEASLSEEWEIWGPNGGYVAAVALRAAGAHSAHPRPASLLCHFEAAASFDPVDIEVETLRQSSRTESLRVSIRQGGRRVLEGLVWAVDDGLDGLVHDAAPAPNVPGHQALPTVEELLRRRGAEGSPHRFFTNLESRPIAWIEDYEHRPAGEPVERCWYRFVPTAAFDDPWLDGGRLAIMIDTFQWPAAARGHAGATLHHIAPSLDLACRFHRLERARRAEWLLVEARSPVADGGLVGGTAAVWDDAGMLLASGGQQMLCRSTSPS